MQKLRGFPVPEAAASEDVDFRGILKLIARRKLIIFGMALLATVLAAVIMVRSPPQYTAKAELMIEGRASTAIERETMTADAAEEVLLTKVELMRSRGLVERVIDQLALRDTPDFAPPNTRWAHQLLSKVSDWAAMLRPHEWVAPAIGASDDRLSSTGPPAANEQADADKWRERDRVFNAFLKRLNVSRQGRTRIVSIEFTARSADMAAAVVNAIADRYLEDQQHARMDLMQRSADWLRDRIAILRADVETAERTVEEFRRGIGLVAARDQGMTLKTAQLQELNLQLLGAVASREQIESRIRQLRQTEATATLTAGPLLQSPLLSSMRENLAVLENRAAQYSQQLGERNPTVVQLRAEIRNLRDRIETERRNLIQGVDNELRIAREREQDLTARIRNLNTEIDTMNSSGIQLRALERDADAKRLLLENFLSRYLATSQQLNNTVETNDRVISYAQPPGRPESLSRQLMMLAGALLGGFALGFGLALLLDRLDGGYRSGEQIEKETGFKVIGLIPLVPRSRRRRSPIMHHADDRDTIFTEALRHLYTSIRLSSGGGTASKIVLVTSTCPGEGKTTTSLCLARMAAQLGRTVAFVEADLRRPRVAEMLGLADGPGLHEALLGQFQLSEVLHPDPESGVHILPAGRATTKLLELGGPHAMERLIAAMANDHDLVIIDTPPVLVASDTRFLAVNATQILFLVRWGRTKREMVGLALKALEVPSAEGSISVALTMVDPKKHARYNFADSSYYNKEIRGYYSKSG